MRAKLPAINRGARSIIGNSASVEINSQCRRSKRFDKGASETGEYDVVVKVEEVPVKIEWILVDAEEQTTRCYIGTEPWEW
jgi:hypothetical protein